MANGKGGKSSNKGGVAPTPCHRNGCCGSIPTQSLAYLLHKGEKPTCRECAKHTPPRRTEYTLKPGIMELFSFKPQGGKPPNGGSRSSTPTNVWGGNKAAEERIKAKEAELAKREKALAAKEKDAKADLNGEGGEPNGGFNNEDSVKIKSLSKQISKLEDLDEEDQVLYFPTSGEYDARIKALKDEQQAIWARNRAKLPVALQHKKQSDFVAKLEKELDDVKKEQHELLGRYKELEDDIKIKNVFLVAKRGELADLANQMAREASQNVPEAVKSASGPAAKLGAEHVQFLDVFKKILSHSNVLDLLKQQGATDDQIKNMEHTWSEVTGAVKETAEVDGGKPNPTVKPPDANAGGAPHAAAPVLAGGSDGAKGGVAPDMDVDHLETLWAKHLDEHPNVAEMDEKERGEHKDSFFSMQRAIKRHKAA